MSTIAAPNDLVREIPAARPKPKPAGAYALVIFGALGDLTKRLLFPSLHNPAQDDLLPEEFAIIGFARFPLSEDQLADQLKNSVREAAGDAPVSDAAPDFLISRLYHVQSDFTEQGAYARLVERLAEVDRKRGTGPTTSSIWPRPQAISWRQRNGWLRWACFSRAAAAGAAS